MRTHNDVFVGQRDGPAPGAAAPEVAVLEDVPVHRRREFVGCVVVDGVSQRRTAPLPRPVALGLADQIVDVKRELPRNGRCLVHRAPSPTLRKLRPLELITRAVMPDMPGTA